MDFNGMLATFGAQLPSWVFYDDNQQCFCYRSSAGDGRGEYRCEVRNCIRLPSNVTFPLIVLNDGRGVFICDESISIYSKEQVDCIMASKPVGFATETILKNPILLSGHEEPACTAEEAGRMIRCAILSNSLTALPKVFQKANVIACQGALGEILYPTMNFGHLMGLGSSEHHDWMSYTEWLIKHTKRYELEWFSIEEEERSAKRSGLLTREELDNGYVWQGFPRLFDKDECYMTFESTPREGYNKHYLLMDCERQDEKYSLLESDVANPLFG